MARRAGKSSTRKYVQMDHHHHPLDFPIVYESSIHPLQLHPQRPLTCRQDHVLGLALRHSICIRAVIPLEPDQLARALALDIHDDEQFCNLHARPAPVKMDFELASLVRALAVDEPLVG